LNNTYYADWEGMLSSVLEYLLLFLYITRVR